MSLRLSALLLGAALSSLMVHQAARAAPVPAKPNPSADSQILLQADQVIYDGDSQTVAAVGHVEIVDQGRILDADRVTYNQKTDTVTADGHVSTTDRLGNVAFSDHVVLTDHMRDGVLNGFGALIGKNGRLTAASAQRVNGTMVIAHYTNYSPCKICNQAGQSTPLWQVKSERVVYDQVAHRIHFTDATVDFLGIPILYAPFLTEPDPTVKYSSGFLIPDVGNATNVGYFLRLPYYIALSPQNDLTVAPQFSTKGGELVETEYRERWQDSGMWLQDSIAYNPDGGLGGHTAGPQYYDHLFGSGHFDIGDGWSAGFSAELTNNTAYMRFYDISFLDRLVNNLFVENDTGRSRLIAERLLFPGPARQRYAERDPLCAAAAGLYLHPRQQHRGRTLPLRHQQRVAHPQRRSRQPAPYQRSGLAPAHDIRRRPALDPDRRCQRRRLSCQQQRSGGFPQCAGQEPLCGTWPSLFGAGLALAFHRRRASSAPPICWSRWRS